MVISAINAVILNESFLKKKPRKETMIEEFVNKMWDEKNKLWYDIYKRDDDEDLYIYKLIPNQKIEEEKYKE